MDAIALFAEKQGGTGLYSDYREIDLFDDEPIRFTKSIQDIEQPTATTSSFTKTFRVPANSSNGQYFQAVFNVNSTNFDATKKASAYININGAYFVGGNIRLTAIFTNGERAKIEYEIVFMGETSTFASIVAPKNMSEINLSDLGHFFDYQNITLSWNAGPGSTGGLVNGNVVYPLAEYGYTYDDNSRPEQSTVAKWSGTTGGSLNGFTNTNFPLSLQQFKPMVRAKRIWDGIFTDAGFTYESAFLDSMFFSNIYMMSTDTNTSGALLDTQVRATAKIQPTYLGDIQLNQLYKIQNVLETLDNANSFSPITAQYTVAFEGAYEIYSFLTVSYTPNAVYTGICKQFSYTMYKNGAPAVSRTAYVGATGPTGNNGIITSQAAMDCPGIGPPNYQIQFNGTFAKGDVLEWKIFPTVGSFANDFYINTGTIEIFGPSAVVPSGLMPTQYKQIDFIKGINDRFKLMWTPDRQNPRNFYIEPWVDWIKNGNQYDWTYKLDDSKDVSIKPLFSTQPRRVIFKDSEESDLYNFSYQQSYKQTFGQLNQDSNIELITGDRTISSIFAPVPVGPIGNSTKFLVPSFAKDTENQVQPMQVKPRLLFYNGIQEAPYPWYLRTTVGGTSSSPQQIQFNYPLASQFNLYPFDASTFDLNWTNSPQFWNAADNIYPPGSTAGIPFSGRTANTCYTKYWEAWFDSTYNSYSRVMEATFALDSTDVYSLNFNDIIMVKDSWWSVIKISDYVLGTKQNVKVQLLKLGNVGITIGATGGSSISGTVLYLQPNLCYAFTLCEAVCCRSISKFNIWTTNKNLYQSAVFYGNPSGTIPAAPGWYYDGTNAFEVNQFGVVYAVGIGDSCDCGPTLYAISVCRSASLCGACCCTSYTTTVYGDNPSLDLCTVLYADSLGTTLLLPNYYYKNADACAQIANNGLTITAFIYCGNCFCGNIEYNGVYARSASQPSLGVYATPAQACSNTGLEGTETIFQNDPLFTDSSVFFFDPAATSPIGSIGDGATGYVSDGQVVKFYQGATSSGATLNCADLTPIDRTNTVNFVIYSVMGTDLVANFVFYTSPDPSTFLYLQEDAYVGVNWYEEVFIDYNPNNFVSVDVTVDTQTILNYNYYQSGIVIDNQRFLLDPGRIYTFQSRGFVENYDTRIEFEFNLIEI
jgi:hypothetical protein